MHTKLVNVQNICLPLPKATMNIFIIKVEKPKDKASGQQRKSKNKNRKSHYGRPQCGIKGPQFAAIAREDKKSPSSLLTS